MGNPSQSYGTSRHLPYGITDHTVLSAISEHTLPNPSQAGQYSIYLPRKDGRISWPGLLVNSYTKLVYLSAVTHPSSNRARCKATTLTETNALTTKANRHHWQTAYLVLRYIHILVFSNKHSLKLTCRHDKTRLLCYDPVQVFWSNWLYWIALMK